MVNQKKKKDGVKILLQVKIKTKEIYFLSVTQSYFTLQVD